MKKSIVLFVSALFLMISMFGVFYAVASTPATEADPIITKSYIDQVVVPQIYSYIDSSAAMATASSFKVVTVGAGKTVLGGEGTEFILRMGTGKIIGSARGGFVDVTLGMDLTHGADIPANHHLICPLADGRALKINSTNDALVMIKGSYTIQ